MKRLFVTLLAAVCIMGPAAWAQDHVQAQAAHVGNAQKMEKASKIEKAEPMSEHATQAIKVDKNHSKAVKATTEAPSKVKVTTSNVKLRKSASSKAAAVTSKGKSLVIKKGTSLKCLGIKGNYYKVSYKGKTGYISTRYAKPD